MMFMKIMPSASLTPPFFIEMPVPSQESEQRCIGVLEVSIFLLDLELFRQRYFFYLCHYYHTRVVVFVIVLVL